MSYIGRDISNLSDRAKLDSITTSATATYNLLLNSVAYVPSSAESLTVSLNGVIQAPQSSYTVSGSTIVFASNLASSDVIDFILAERAITLTTIGSGTVTTSNIVDANVTTAKIADNAVTTDKLAIANANTTTGNVRINDKTGDQTEGNPQYTFSSNTGTGMRRASSDTIAFDTGSTERLRNSSGIGVVKDMFIGTTSHIDDRRLSLLYSRATHGGMLIKNGDSASEAFHMTFQNTNGTVGSITVSGTSTAYNTSSDYRLKENVDYTFDATSRLKQLKPARFNFIADADKTVDGFLAHEVSSVVPEAILGEKDALIVWKDGEELPDGFSVGDNKLDDNGNTIPKYQGIDQSKLVPLLVKTIQELEARITELENA